MTVSDTALPQKPLTEAEVITYRDRGSVIPQYKLNEQTLELLKAAIKRLIAQNPHIRPEELRAPHIARKNAYGVVGCPQFLELATSDQILDAVEQVIGPDIILWNSQVIRKSGVDGREIPWHQDGHYWHIRPLTTVSVWIAVDDVDVDNGCMRVILDSHKQGLLRHEDKHRQDLVFNDELDSKLFDESKAVNVVLKPGEFSMHDVNLIHGSQPNRSGRSRTGYVIRYMPSTSHFDRSHPNISPYWSRWPLWLVRGVDRCGKNDLKIGHDQ